MSNIFNIVWAAFLPVLFILGCSKAKAMDDIDVLAIYGVDRVSCHLYVPQETIKRHIANVAMKYDISPSEAVIAAARMVTDMQDRLNQTGRMAEYCEGRRLK